MILRGYFDESYDKDVFTLCCSVSNATGWIAIADGWRKCLNAKNKSLRSQGRPPISRYHSSHANSRDYEFEGWTREERDELAIKLMGTLRRGRAWIDTVAYSLPLKEFVNKFKIEGDPLPFCYKELLKFVMLEINSKIEDAHKFLRFVKPIKYVLFHERCSYDDA
ncbi:MAG: hypothetical protein WA676_16155, partial [Candidatus Sulfotelmatobacter sp.]